jgi:molecular chaperone GrpE
LTRKGHAKDKNMNRFEVDAGLNQEADETAQTAENAFDKTAPDAEDIENLRSELEHFRKQAEADREQLLRVSAEFENYKKRAQRHMEDFKKYANEALLRELLTVVDNLERAISSSVDIAAAKSSDACIVEGVELTLKEIMRVLEKFHVTPIDALGKSFDPSIHEAVMQEETDVFPSNTVCKVLQKGYMIHDRLLRPAMVSVSCG